MSKLVPMTNETHHELAPFSRHFEIGATRGIGPYYPADWSRRCEECGAVFTTHPRGEHMPRCRSLAYPVGPELPPGMESVGAVAS